MNDLFFDELQSALVQVVSEAGHASMSEKLNLVVQFDDLRVLILSELIAILLVNVKLGPIIVIIIVIVVVFIEEGIIIVILTVEIGTFDKIVLVISNILK